MSISRNVKFDEIAQTHDDPSDSPQSAGPISILRNEGQLIGLGLISFQRCCGCVVYEAYEIILHGKKAVHRLKSTQISKDAQALQLQLHKTLHFAKCVPRCRSPQCRAGAGADQSVESLSVSADVRLPRLRKRRLGISSFFTTPENGKEKTGTEVEACPGLANPWKFN